MKKSSKRKKRKKNRLFRFVVFLIIVGLFYGSYHYFNKSDEENKLKEFLTSVNTDIIGSVDYYAIYGVHLNIKGEVTIDSEFDDISLVLANYDDEIIIDCDFESNSNSYSFETSSYINEGINLETLDTGNYYLLIKTTQSADDEDIINYYSLENTTTYDDLEYYTITKNNSNNSININWDSYDDVSLLNFLITDTTLPDDVYDITLDPGHGGSDSGAIVYLNGETIQESELNLEIALYVKSYLEDMGYKVAITRTDDDEEITTYESGGRAVLANETKSKFNFAIHNNTLGFTGGANTISGLEIYVGNDSTFTLASSLVSSITSYASTTTSTRKLYKSADGIYQRFFTEEEIEEDTVQPSKRTTNTSYYYFIREVGGISTNATNDGSYEPKYSKNPYYDSNCTAEGLLLELGYLDNESNLKNIINNTKNYALGIATGFDNYVSSFSS